MLRSFPSFFIDCSNASVQATILLNIGIMRGLLSQVPADLQRSGTVAIRGALLLCNEADQSKLYKNLLAVAHNMLMNFRRLFIDHGYEEPWSGRYPPIADLLDIEGNQLTQPHLYLPMQTMLGSSLKDLLQARLTRLARDCTVGVGDEKHVQK